MTKPTSGRLFARLIRLGRQDDAAFLLQHVISRNAVANDNLPPTDGMNVDTVMVMRPTLEEIRRASIPVKDGKPDTDGEIGLRFNAKGKMVEYRAAAEDGTPVLGSDGKELWLRPVERYRQPKGSRRKTRVDAAADNNAHGMWLLSLRGIGAMPDAWVADARYPSLGAFFELLRTAYNAMLSAGLKSENRDLLCWLGVDGSRTLAQCQDANPEATVTRCKAGMAWKVDFLCGKPEANAMATEGSFVGAPDTAETAMIAKMDAGAVSAQADDALEMALSGMTAKEISASRGWDGKHGERKALLEIDASIAQLRRAA